MKFLFIHQNFPSQFRFLAPKLVELGHEVCAFTLQNIEAQTWRGVKLIRYSLSRSNATDGHPWTVDFESKVVRAEACMRASMELKKRGYYPDIIIAHPGWGESLFLKQVWPKALMKLYCEFFYAATGQDVGFDPEFANKDDADIGRVLLKNSNILLHFQHADSGISPTHWQARTFPKEISDRITVIHDGIDTHTVKPNHAAELQVNDQLVVSRKDEVITFVSRSLEPYRGFHTFVRCLPTLLAERPNAHVLIVGKEGYSYGGVPPNGKSWKPHFLQEIDTQLDDNQRSRIHFLGSIPYTKFVTLLQVSTVHVYLTYPFVLSWSLLEAMSAACAVVASATQPLAEVITDNENGILTDFFNPNELAGKISNLLNDEDTRIRLGEAARNFAVRNFDLESVCLPKQLIWSQSVE